MNMSSSLMRCAAVISSLFLMVAFGHAQSINGRISGPSRIQTGRSCLKRLSR